MVTLVDTVVLRSPKPPVPHSEPPSSPSSPYSDVVEEMAANLEVLTTHERIPLRDLCDGAHPPRSGALAAAAQPFAPYIRASHQAVSRLTHRPRSPRSSLPRRPPGCQALRRRSSRPTHRPRSPRSSPPRLLPSSPRLSPLMSPAWSPHRSPRPSLAPASRRLHRPTSPRPPRPSQTCLRRSPA